jgi:hypothetical protein
MAIVVVATPSAGLRSSVSFPAIAPAALLMPPCGESR